MSYSFLNLLGGGVPGFQPKLIGGGAGSKGWTGMDGANGRGLSRVVLREAFGNSTLNNGNPAPLINASSGLTPFRKAMNAGDTALSQNSAPNPSLPQSNQLNSQRVSRLNIKGDSVKNNGSALYSGNPKYVYDGSDYARYKTLKAINKTYNDKSFGGANNGSFVAYKRVRH